MPIRWGLKGYAIGQDCHYEERLSFLFFPGNDGANGASSTRRSIIVANLCLIGPRPKGLEPVDLEVVAGELVFLSGPSGLGKSLLLGAIADLDPHAGEVLIDGVPCSTVSAPGWYR